MWTKPVSDESRLQFRAGESGGGFDAFEWDLVDKIEWMGHVSWIDRENSTYNVGKGVQDPINTIGL